MIKRFIAALAALALLGGGTLAVAVASPAEVSAPSTDLVAVAPGQTAMLGRDGTISVDTVSNTSITTYYRAQSCEVSEQWQDFGISRNWHGQVIIRVPWTIDTRGSDRDVTYINWSYNPPGSGSGEGTGISFENNTNYVAFVTEAEMRNIPSGVIWQQPFVNTNVAQDNKDHIVGISDFFTGNPNGHSYWDNAPRVRTYFGVNPAYNGPDDICDNYTPGQPST